MIRFRRLAMILMILAEGAARAWAADRPWLHAEGTRIADQDGKPVILRGVNLGGWLVEEMWMMPFQTKPPAELRWPEVKDHVSLWRPGVPWRSRMT